MGCLWTAKALQGHILTICSAEGEGWLAVPWAPWLRRPEPWEAVLVVSAAQAECRGPTAAKAPGDRPGRAGVLLALQGEESDRPDSTRKVVHQLRDLVSSSY